MDEVQAMLARAVLVTSLIAVALSIPRLFF
jgi:hypothetical protein